jgi:RNA polymerase III transcription factor (TF)IIIC subunit HTH domain
MLPFLWSRFVLTHSILKEEQTAMLGKRDPLNQTDSGHWDGVAGELGGNKPEAKKISLISLKITDKIVPTIDEQTQRLAVLRSLKTNAKDDEDTEQLLQVVQSLFKQKPVWLKQSIEWELSQRGITYPSDFTLKKILACVSYLFKNGPWKFTYVRLGYDPRKHKESLVYQAFNVGIGNRNFLMGQDSGGVNTDFKRRNYENVQLCEVNESNILRLVAHLKKENEGNHHQQCDERLGWVSDKKYYSYIVKRLKEHMRRKSAAKDYPGRH